MSNTRTFRDPDPEPEQPRYPTLDEIASLVTSHVTWLKGFAAAANSRELSLRIDQLNSQFSDYCKGQKEAKP